MKKSFMSLIICSALYCTVSAQEDKSDLYFNFTEVETWTSSVGSEIEARLTGVNKQGQFVLSAASGKELIISPEQLSEDSLARANALVAKASADAGNETDSAENSKPKKSNSGGGSFFGIAMGGDGDEGDVSTDDQEDYTDVATDFDSSGVTLAKTTWQRKMRRGKSIKISFSEDKIIWADSNDEIEYERSEDGLTIYGENRTMKVVFINENAMRFVSGAKRPIIFRRVTD